MRVYFINGDEIFFYSAVSVDIRHERDVMEEEYLGGGRETIEVGQRIIGDMALAFTGSHSLLAERTSWEQVVVINDFQGHYYKLEDVVATQVDLQWLTGDQQSVRVGFQARRIVQLAKEDVDEIVGTRLRTPDPPLPVFNEVLVLEQGFRHSGFEVTQETLESILANTQGPIPVYSPNDQNAGRLDGLHIEGGTLRGNLQIVNEEIAELMRQSLVSISPVIHCPEEGEYDIQGASITPHPAQPNPIEEQGMSYRSPERTCPICGETMILTVPTGAYHSCLKCKKLFTEEELEHEEPPEEPPGRKVRL